MTSEEIAALRDQIDKLIESQERCNRAIEKLTEDTSGIIALYGNAQGLITVGANVQKLALWVAKWPLIGAGMYTVYQWAMSHAAQLP